MPRVLVFLILALPLVGAYAMYASGIVVIYQASRVLNLAHGAMVTIPAYLTYTMSVRWGVPMVVAVPFGVATGALMGIGIERIFVRRLRGAGPTAQTVGTVAAFGLTVAVAAKVWGTTGLAAPLVFPDGGISVGSSTLRYGQIGLAVVSLVSIGLVAALFRFTWLGLAMRGAAENRRAASLLGVDPDVTSSVAWAIGGSLAAIAGILLAAVTVLHPLSLSVSVLPAFVAALIGGLGSLGGALLGAVVVGVVIGFVPILADLPVLSVVLGQVGGPELALAVAAMIVMAVRGRRFVPTDVRSAEADEASDAPRLLPRIPRPLLAVIAVGWVWIPGMPFTILGDANTALVYTIAAASLVLLTGWIGQISLAQAAFVGIGAFGSVQVSSRLGIPFPFTLAFGAAFAGLFAALLGVVALRVRGLYLAVATLIFAWMADQYLFSAPWLVGAGGSATAEVEPIGIEGGFPYIDLADRRVFYLVALAVTAFVLIGMTNLRRTKTGRAFFAIRGSEMAAASLGINVTRTKLLAFAVSGAIAGIAGSMIAVAQETVVPAQFSFTASLFYLSIAVVGGLRSLGGAVASAVVFSLLNEVFFRVEALHGWLDVVSAALLVAVLLFYPGGLARAPEAIRAASLRLRGLGRALSNLRVTGSQLAAQAGAELSGLGRELAVATSGALLRLERSAPESWRPRVKAFGGQVRGLGGEMRALRSAVGQVAARLSAVSLRARTPEAAPVARATPVQPIAPEGVLGQEVLAARAITVRFGGVTAVDDASLSVNRGEIVGLIGPNGAGKTTMFNAVAGFVTPQRGEVLLNGRDITSLGVHERAALGIGRTFQSMQLLGDLTVRENLMVATHVENPSGFLSNLVVTAGSVEAERAVAERVTAASALVGIDEVLDRPVAGLPFGTLRMVEIARAVATGAPVIMLDEAASGLDDAETRAFAGLILSLRDRLGMSLLLIEHDVALVMEVCDRVHVLDRGRMIAVGAPDDVRADERVRAAYLGGGPQGAS